jgi:hypothetical protein
MSLLRTIRQQLGLSVTPANNFTLDASADNGTMKLSRGNAGSGTQDILTVNSLGEVDFPQMVRSLAADGYQKLPGGLIVQWGVSASVTATSQTVTLPITFPNVFASVVAQDQASGTSTVNMRAVNIINTSSFELWNATSTFIQSHWIAIGY